MIIPQNNLIPQYFKSIFDMNKSLGLPELSMGMSSDCEDAVRNNSTFVRIEVIFSEREIRQFLL